MTESNDTVTIEVSRETLEFALSQMDSAYLNEKEVDYPFNGEWNAEEMKEMRDELKELLE